MAVLKAVKNNPGISRPEISKQTGLTTVTVNSLVAELVERNLVLEGGHAESCGGRKAQTYIFNNDAFLVIGVNLRVGAGTVGISNLAGNEIADLVFFPLDNSHGVEETLQTISEIIRRMLDEYGISRSRIKAIGVSAPGMISSKTGIIRSIPNLTLWKNVTIKEYLEESTGIPVFVDKDTNSALICLKLESSANQEKDMLLLAVDEGVGSGVFLNGVVFHGLNESFGELGHTTVNINGPPCSCGNYGCVELYASNRAIISEYIKVLEGNGADATDIKSLMGSSHRENAYIMEMAKKASAGDRPAAKAFRHALVYIETLIVNAINIYGVPEIVLECPWLRINENLFNEMLGNIYKRLPGIDRTELKISLNQKTDLFSKAPYMLAANSIFEYD